MSQGRRTGPPWNMPVQGAGELPHVHHRSMRRSWCCNGEPSVRPRHKLAFHNQCWEAQRTKAEIGKPGCGACTDRETRRGLERRLGGGSRNKPEEPWSRPAGTGRSFCGSFPLDPFSRPSWGLVLQFEMCSLVWDSVYCKYNPNQLNDNTIL